MRIVALLRLFLGRSFSRTSAATRHCAHVPTQCIYDKERCPWKSQQIADIYLSFRDLGNQALHNTPGDGLEIRALDHSVISQSLMQHQHKGLRRFIEQEEKQVPTRAELEQGLF